MTFGLFSSSNMDVSHRLTFSEVHHASLFQGWKARGLRCSQRVQWHSPCLWADSTPSSRFSSPKTASPKTWSFRARAMLEQHFHFANMPVFRKDLQHVWLSSQSDRNNCSEFASPGGYHPHNRLLIILIMPYSWSMVAPQALSVWAVEGVVPSAEYPPNFHGGGA